MPAGRSQASSTDESCTSLLWGGGLRIWVGILDCERFAEMLPFGPGSWRRRPSDGEVGGRAPPEKLVPTHPSGRCQSSADRHRPTPSHPVQARTQACVEVSGSESQHPLMMPGGLFIDVVRGFHSGAPAIRPSQIFFPFFSPDRIWDQHELGRPWLIPSHPGLVSE